MSKLLADGYLQVAGLFIDGVNMEKQDQRIAELEKHIAQLYEGLQGAIDISTILLIHIGKNSPESLAEYIELLVSLRNDVVEKNSMRETVIDQMLSSLLGEEGVPLAKRRGIKLVDNAMKND